MSAPVLNLLNKLKKKRTKCKAHLAFYNFLATSYKFNNTETQMFASIYHIEIIF